MSPLLNLLGKEGITAGALERIYAGSRFDTQLAAEAIRGLRQLDADVAWRAVWLLKRLAQDRDLSEEELVQIARGAVEASHWASQLNLCQLFARTGCPPSERDALYPWLVECFGNRRVIVRAWALSVLVGFRGDPAFRPAVDAMLRQARRDPAKSMQARLRQLAAGKRRSGGPAGRR